VEGIAGNAGDSAPLTWFRRPSAHEGAVADQRRPQFAHVDCPDRRRPPEPDRDAVDAASAAAVPPAWPTAIEMVMTRIAASASCVADRPRPTATALTQHPCVSSP